MDDDMFDDDDDAMFYPIWLTALRGFVDLREKEASHFNELLSRHLSSAVQSWTCDDVGWTFSFVDADVFIANSEFEPLKVTAASDTMSRKYLDGMRVELRRILDEITELHLSTMGFAVTLLQLTEEAVIWLHLWATNGSLALSNPKARTSYGKSIEDEGWNASEVRDWSSVIDNQTGLNLTSVEDTAQFILGEPIKDICTRFLDTWKAWYQMMRLREDPRILHVEPVFRNDLVSRFLKRKEAIHKDLMSTSYTALRQSVPYTEIPRGKAGDTKEGLAEYLSKPHVTFHGAPRHVIQSIVRYGFIVPGQQIGNSEKQLAVRCGSSFGVGIYSSPDPVFAVAYTDYYSGRGSSGMPFQVKAMKLIVCTTLLGRALQVSRAETRRMEGLLDERAHSHVSPNKLEYIVFDSAQIIPCYVIHLDFGAQIAREEFEKVANDPGEYFRQRQMPRLHRDGWSDGPDLCPGDLQRKKEAIKAAATKWFPYGFGSATGTNFVIEEIGETSDDEEVYGDFQQMRIDAADEMHEYDVHEAKVAMGSASWFDEYQTVRKTNKKLDGG